MKIKKIIQSPFEGNHSDCVTLTMTCSKRLSLFKQSLPSFVEKCQDTHFISKVIIFDDSSTTEDRYEMERITESLFPSTNIDFVYFDSIPTKHRHAYIMQHWFDMLNSNFVFHLEDDWRITDTISLRESIDILKNDWEVIAVGYAQTLREFPDDFLTAYKNTEFGKNKDIIYSKNAGYWVWPYVDTKGIGDIMFYDTVRCTEGSAEYNCNYWEYFINYPPFGLQPSVMDVVKLKLIGNFNIDYANDTAQTYIEGNYGLRVCKKFYSICSLKKKVLHLGSEYLGQKSAYDLNQSSR